MSSRIPRTISSRFVTDGDRGRTTLARDVSSRDSDSLMVDLARLIKRLGVGLAFVRVKKQPRAFGVVRQILDVLVRELH